MLQLTRPSSLTGLATLFLAVVAASCAEESAASPEGPLPQRVLLISLDTLRADHTGFGGYFKPTTPFLDSLAARGVVFDNHFANSNCTLPSHASMLTGLHFPAHGLRPDLVKALPTSVETLAERFQAEGYFTSAFTSHGTWLTAEYGFDQGFDHFVSRWCAADETIDDYLKLLDEGPYQNSFTFLHFFDIHSDAVDRGPCLPYVSNKELVKEFAGEMPADFTGCSSYPGRERNCASNYLNDISMNIEKPSAEHLKFIVGLYDAGIRRLDDQLRDFFGELEKRGALENTLIVITADHGEAFYEHGKMLHDGHEDPIARVPLIVLLPESSKVPPRRIQAMTQSTDLAPTILDLCGFDVIGQTPSLASAVMLGEEPEDALVLFQGHILIGSDDEGQYKFVKTQGSPVFFDRTADPMERVDLLGDKQFAVDHRERLLEIYTKLETLTKECYAINIALKSVDRSDGIQQTPEQVKKLKDLGYLGGNEPSETTQELPLKPSAAPKGSDPIEEEVEGNAPPRTRP